MASSLPVEKPSGEANGAANGEDKRIDLAKLKEHSTREDLWLLIHGKVYDVTKFLDEHPGGDEVLIEEAGHDGTEAFDDIGHSDEANNIMVGMLVGEFKGEAKQAKAAPATRSTTTGSQSSGGFPIWVLPAGLLVAYLGWRIFYA